MDEKIERVAFASLLAQAPAELRAQAEAHRAEAQKMRFKHAMGQLRETHRMRHGRRALARLLTAATQGERGSTGGAR